MIECIDFKEMPLLIWYLQTNNDSANTTNFKLLKELNINTCFLCKFGFICDYNEDASINKMNNSSNEAMRKSISIFNRRYVTEIS